MCVYIYIYITSLYFIPPFSTDKIKVLDGLVVVFWVNSS